MLRPQTSLAGLLCPAARRCCATLQRRYSGAAARLAVPPLARPVAKHAQAPLPLPRDVPQAPAHGPLVPEGALSPAQYAFAHRIGLHGRIPDAGLLTALRHPSKHADNRAPFLRHVLAGSAARARAGAAPVWRDP